MGAIFLHWGSNSKVDKFDHTTHDEEIGRLQIRMNYAFSVDFLKIKACLLLSVQTLDFKEKEMKKYGFSFHTCTASSISSQ